jgi:FixJ family two-component response regulator
MFSYAQENIRQRSMAQGIGEAPIVHIVDDDESMREVLASLLRSVALTARTYASVDAFLSVRRPDAPGCLILDVTLPGMSGLDFQSQLTEVGIELPVILMSGYGDVPMSVRGMKAGAVDFLVKPFRDQDMLDAVAVAINRDRTRRAASAESFSLRQKFASLSPRERQVMGMAVAGKLNKQIAGDLGISLVTVKIHRGAVMRKMGARTIADLVRLSEALSDRP